MPIIYILMNNFTPTHSGYAPYYYTSEDRVAIDALGSTADAEKSVCERLGHVFTQGPDCDTNMGMALAS